MNIQELKSRIDESFNNKTEEEGSGRISFSQYSLFAKCPKSWELAYGRGLRTYQPSIHTAFGTAFHETLQNFLGLYLDGKKSEALSIDLKEYLKQQMLDTYMSEYDKSNIGHFSTAEELAEFYQDGCDILHYLSSRMNLYFDPDRYDMMGIEAPLFLQAIDSNDKVNMLSFVDIVLYDKIDDRLKIVDIKTSTRGWGKWALEDPVKVSQVYFYKHYFSKQYDFPVDKIDVEFFIVKRRVPKDAEFAVMQRRVQSFKPASGPRKTKQVLDSLNNFISSAIDSNGEYIDKEYKCTNPFGKCEHCTPFVN